MEDAFKAVDQHCGDIKAAMRCVLSGTTGMHAYLCVCLCVGGRGGWCLAGMFSSVVAFV